MKIALAVLLLTGCEPPPFSPVDRTPAPRPKPIHNSEFKILNAAGAPRVIFRTDERPAEPSVRLIWPQHPSPEPTIRIITHLEPALTVRL